MSLYIARRISKLPRRILSEIAIELKLLSEKWKLLLAGLIFQYIHGLAARGVHYLHTSGHVLHDLGLLLLPELRKERGYVSKILFASIFGSFVLGLAVFPSGHCSLVGKMVGQSSSKAI